MKLLLENWLNYLNEDAGASIPWLKDLEALDDPALTDVRKAFPEWEVLGAGSYRGVMAPKGETDYIIKIVHDKRDVEQNKGEYEVSRDFPSLFPRVYAHHPNFNWIIADQVDVIDRLNTKFFQAFKAAFPKVTDYAMEVGVENPMFVYYALLSAAAIGSDPDLIAGLDTMQQMIVKKIGMDKISKIREFGLKNSEPFQNFASAIAKYDMNISDLTVGNIGINSDGKWIIIDAAI
jgi:hypothetical protein